MAASFPRDAVSREQEMLSEILATGSVPIQEEIKMRASMADHLILSYEQHRDEQFLFDAIAHLETILRRLPKDSPDLPKHLDTLSSTKMTEYTRINSQHTLDQAILYGRKAKDAAVATGLLQRHPATYFRILTNLGFALAHRNALTEKLEDLDEAIACGREIYATASADSDPYQITLNNLASRLRIRYILRADPNDINEAKRLVNELLECTTPGTIQHATAVAQLGSITSDKFRRTGMLRDLDEAIGHVKIGLEAFPAGHETRVALLQQVVGLYDARYRRMRDAADLEELIRYSTLLIEAIPPRHSGKGKYFLYHLKYLQEQVVVTNSGAVLQRTIDLVQAMLQAMPKDYAEKSQCQEVMANLFGMRYAISGKFEDLDSLARYVERISHEHNDTADKAGSSKPGVDTAWLYRLIESVSQIFQAPADNSMRSLAEEELLESFRSFLKSGEGAIAALERLNKGQGLRLKVLAKAIEAGRTLFNDEITAEMTRVKDEEDAAEKERQQTPRYRPLEYMTELGHRQFVIDPQTRNIVMDFSGLIKSILGYDPTQSLSHEEFAAREAKMERESIEKTRADGRYPNLNLCRMCRDFTKPLRPTTEGFELTAQKSVLPFGSFFQLDLRKNCSICRLVLSMISTRSGNIHPQLGAINREIQGTRLSTGKLYTGEKLMRVDYGMRQVGEVRILARGNYRQALRQAWEARGMSTLLELLAEPYGPINNRNGQQVNPDLIKTWLNNCDHNHGATCNNPRSGKRAENDIPMTFIDVDQQCLVTASSQEKYFALSYIWGRVEMSKTLRDNFVRRHAPWALRGEHLPKTTKDAMTLVRNLGERFLWVDAICLVQDDPEQMARDIPNMDLVYGKAFATIVAMHGEDANAGLPGVAPGERAPQRIETIKVSNMSFDLDHDPQCEKNETISLVATPRPLHLALEVSKWNTRGWILQERLLSRRCVYFSSDAVYFQCNKETLSEGGANEEFKACLLDSIPLDDEHMLRNANHNNPLSVLNALYDLDQRDRRRKAFTAYNKLVETYSGRNLSFKSDILNAFGGMFAVLDEHLQRKTFYGLPAAVFSHALLWAPARRISRRGACLPASLSASTGEPDPEFPSWSWAGWDGPIEYQLFEEADGNPVLPTPIVRFYKIGGGSSSQIIEVEDYAPGPAEGQTTEIDFLDTKSSPGMSQDTSETKRNKVIAKMVPDGDRSSTWVIMPPLRQQAPVPVLEKNILRFTAPTVPVTAFQVMPRKEYISLQSHIHIRGEQAVRRIHDREGRQCGLWWEQAGYGYVGLGMSPEAESKIDMVGISYYGDAYKPRKGPNRVEGEIRIFDDEVFPAVGPGSGLVNVLVADMDMGHPDGIGDRCTVAVIHVKAWLAAHPQKKEVPLA